LILPRWHYLHIHNDVIPVLKRKGVTVEHLKEMLVENPRKIFERQGAYCRRPFVRSTSRNGVRDWRNNSLLGVASLGCNLTLVTIMLE